MSLRLQLNLLITALSLIFFVISSAVLIHDVKVSIQERVEAAHQVTVQLLDNVALNIAMNPSAIPPQETFVDFLKSLGYVRSGHLVFYQPSGEILYESPRSHYREDISPPLWFVKLVSIKFMGTQRLVFGGRLSIGMDATGAVREAWRTFLPLLWIDIAFFLLLNIVVYVFIGWALSPIKPILQAIHELEAGNLDVKLPPFNLAEFNLIGNSFNRMAKSLGAELALKETRQWTQAVQNHIEEERRSLARELHDGLGQYVTAIKTFAVSIPNLKSSSDIEKSVEMIVMSANHIYEGMHRIVQRLRPEMMDNLGLAESLRHSVQIWQKMYPSMNFVLELQGELDDLGEEVNINLYRIVQEAVNNALRYASAHKIDILLANKEGNLVLKIADDGVGLTKADDTKPHFGLIGMRERVQSLGGQFEVVSKKGQGVRIEVQLGGL